MIGILIWYGLLASMIVAFQYRTIAELEAGRERDHARHVSEIRHMHRSIVYTVSRLAGRVDYEAEECQLWN